MPRFVFLSGLECGNVDQALYFGILFPVGVAVEASDPHVIGKLRGNRFFRECEAGDAVSEPSEPRKRARGRPRREA